MEHLIATVSVPDRPGGLGAVASRIGALGIDIVDVSVSGRATGIAEDVFHLDAPRHGPEIDIISLLIAELSEVDDAALIAVIRVGECATCGPARQSA